MVRYDDDAVVLRCSRKVAIAAPARMRARVSQNGLTLHPNKTHIGDCRAKYQGFEFLVYRFETGQRWVRRESLLALRDKIRVKTTRTVVHSMERVIASLNSALRDWFSYCQHAGQFVFSSIGGLVRCRLRAILRRPERRPGEGRCRLDRSRWSNAFFANLGLFAMSEAHRSARHPIWKQLTGEPIATEPRSRSGARGWQTLFPTAISHSTPLNMAETK